MITTTDESLLAAASQARQNAYADYSGFLVGAALLTTDGTIVTGCNVENASYGLSICAERTAVVRAIAMGYTQFNRIAVVASPLATPCGACRQFVVEFGGRNRCDLRRRQRFEPFSKMENCGSDTRIY